MILLNKIYLEYDCSYWHDFNEKNGYIDSERDEQLKSDGWKVIRFRDRIPTTEELSEELSKKFNEGR